MTAHIGLTAVYASVFSNMLSRLSSIWSILASKMAIASGTNSSGLYWPTDSTLSIEC